MAAIATPFSIVIEQERMLVTKVNTNTNVWTVTRPTGGTSPGGSPASFNAPVMSTPFPIVQTSSGYNEAFNSYVNRLAPICVKAINRVPGDLTGLQFRAIIIDGSDGVVRLGSF